MKKINVPGTKVFCKLLKKFKQGEILKLEAENFLPLSMEEIEENILTPAGVGTLYSLMHYYKQNGDLMRDPEMRFIVVDNRRDEIDFEMIAIYPQMYQQDNLGLYEESVGIDNGIITHFIKRWQDAHCAFANTWPRNISSQGFLK